MSEDKLNKNGIWQGNQSEYFKFSKEIILDSLDGKFKGIPKLHISALLSNILNNIPQKKLELTISKYCIGLEKLVGNKNNKLGLLIKNKNLNNE